MTPTALSTEIQAANDRFMAAVRAGDQERFVRLYTNDAVLLLPGRDALVGHAGAQAFFESLKARAVREVRLTTLEVEGFGDTAWERGRSEVIGPDGTPIGKGKYMVIWKRTSEGWKLHRDIMNASA
jgi:uncharacterized protein (TIGR02246 family)